MDEKIKIIAEVKIKVSTLFDKTAHKMSDGRTTHKPLTKSQNIVYKEWVVFIYTKVITSRKHM